MSSLLRTASWVIVDKSTNKAIFETFSKSITDKINVEKYQAVPILEYLQNLNKTIKGQ
jgi:hypothetical protein